MGVRVQQVRECGVRQIREKGCAMQYKGDRRPVTFVGVNFRTTKRNIDEPKFGKLGVERFMEFTELILGQTRFRPGDCSCLKPGSCDICALCHFGEVGLGD